MNRKTSGFNATIASQIGAGLSCLQHEPNAIRCKVFSGSAAAPLRAPAALASVAAIENIPNHTTHRTTGFSMTESLSEVSTRVSRASITWNERRQDGGELRAGGYNHHHANKSFDPQESFGAR